MRSPWYWIARSAPLTAWLASRVVVLIALAAAQPVGGTARAGLLDWDAAWYLDIAEHGYAGAGDGAIRFFPAWPLLVRAVSTITLLPATVVLIGLANLLTLLLLILARRVALNVGLDDRAADLVPWLVVLAPAGFVTVMGYSEPLFGVLLAAVLLAVRRERWWLAAAAGLAEGATRPQGVLLLLLVAVPSIRGIAAAAAPEAIARVAALAAPVAGLAAFLAWAGIEYGDPLAPFAAQLTPGLRGGAFLNPIATLVNGLAVFGTGVTGSFVVHLLWIPVALWLIAVCARRLPRPQTSYAAAALALALTARNFSSFERYAGAALPLTLAAARALAARRAFVRRATLAVLAALLLVDAFLAFIGWYLP